MVCPVSSPQPNTRKAASSKVHPTPPPRCSPSHAWLPCPSTCLPSQSSHHLCFQDFSFFFCPFSLVFKHSIDKRKKKRKPLLEPHFHLWLPPVSHLPVTAKLSKKLSAPLFPLLTSLSLLNPIPSATARPQPPERPKWLSLRSVTTPRSQPNGQRAVFHLPSQQHSTGDHPLPRPNLARLRGPYSVLLSPDWQCHICLALSLGHHNLSSLNLDSSFSPPNCSPCSA